MQWFGDRELCRHNCPILRHNSANVAFLSPGIINGLSVPSVLFHIISLCSHATRLTRIHLFLLILSHKNSKTERLLRIVTLSVNLEPKRTALVKINRFSFLFSEVMNLKNKAIDLGAAPFIVINKSRTVFCASVLLLITDDVIKCSKLQVEQ